jgi:hypothetical protein
MAIKGDSLVEQLLNYAKKGLFVNSAERELVKRAAMRIQTLQAEKYLRREQEPKKPKISELRRKYCGDCGWELVSEADRYCRHCGREVKWDENT